jgi:hypothetical protein
MNEKKRHHFDKKDMFFEEYIEMKKYIGELRMKKEKAEKKHRFSSFLKKLFSH